MPELLVTHHPRLLHGTRSRVLGALKGRADCFPGLLCPWCFITGSRPSSTSVMSRRRFLWTTGSRSPAKRKQLKPSASLSSSSLHWSRRRTSSARKTKKHQSQERIEYVLPITHALVGFGPRPVTVGNYFPYIYIYTPRKSTTVWRPLEFPVFGGPNCSAGLGVREPRLSIPEFGIWSIQYPTLGGRNCSAGF